MSNEFSARLNAGFKMTRSASPGVRDIAVIRYVSGSEFGDHPDSVMLQVLAILIEIDLIYRYGKNIVLDKGDELLTLVESGEPTQIAGSILANYFLVQNEAEDTPQPPNRTFLQHVFNNEIVLRELPVIKQYSRIPTYDENFNLVQPGYDPESQIMVHGEPIEPIPFTPISDASLPVQERVPAIIRDVLVDFPFATSLDYLKTVGLYLIGLLAPRFTATGRPIGLLDGNQPGIGKTLIANIIGVLLDGTVPAPTEFSNTNDELSKRILATIRSSRQSVILIDNARAPGGGVINSTSLEAMSVAETLSLRILGSSANHVAPNDFVWLLSMNDMKTTPDLAQRGILINLEYEGPSSDRKYRHNDLVAFVKERRMMIIGTFYGMIEYWKSQGRPDGRATHRFNNMARITSGILDTCGLSGFLADHQKNVQAINSTADDLIALFDSMIKSARETVLPNTAMTFCVPHEPLAPSALVRAVENAKIAEDELAAAKNDRAKATKVGLVFSRLLNAAFPVEVGDRTGTATFVKVSLPRNRIGYQFQVELAAVVSGTNEANPETDLFETGKFPIPDGETECPF